MKVCEHCGHQDVGDAGVCQMCGTGSPGIPVGAAPGHNLPALTDMRATERPGLNVLFERTEGFSRPDWQPIRAFIKERVPKEDWPDAWRGVVAEWMKELAGDLGGNARVTESRRFFCLSDLDAETTKSLVDYAESAVDTIRGYLKAAAWSG